MYSLLFIDDDCALSDSFEKYFGETSLVRIAGSLTEAIGVLREFRPDLVVLDLVLPDGSGLDFLQSGAIAAPVIILSSLGDDETMLAGLSSCVDYCVKPVSLPVLEKRILLRLGRAGKSVATGGLVVDETSRSVTYRGKPVPLTASEFNLLSFLTEHPDQVFTAEALYESVWGMKALRSTSVRYHLSNLRQKLKSCAPGKNFISTRFGKGYLFDPGPDR